MKVIKKGHFEDRMRVICPHCEAVLEITSQDVKCVQTASRKLWGYLCPCCDHTNCFDGLWQLTIGVSLNVKQ